jgi:hypothetical protein
MTATVKSIFYRCGAWVGRIDSETRCRFWWRHPTEINFDPVLLVPVDLSKTPEAAREGRIDWDQIQVDDLTDHSDESGVTTLGPWFPDGKMTGAVYLEKTYRERLRDEIRPVFPPPGYPAREYEFMTVVYRHATGNPRAGVRYHGYHARILKEGPGTNAFIAIHQPGRSKASEPPIERTLDLASLHVDTHTDEGGLTEIAHGRGKRKEGAVFIDLVHAKAIGLLTGKDPLASGINVATPGGLIGERIDHLAMRPVSG